jgi:hypothetical protein
VTTLPPERTLRGGPIAPGWREKLGRAGCGPGSIPEGSRGRVKYISWYKNNIITYILYDDTLDKKEEVVVNHVTPLGRDKTRE